MCDEWLQNKLVNPKTGRKIKSNGPTYNIWKTKCEDQNKDKDCDEWLQNKLVNPKTGRKIKRNGPTYNIWKTKCEENESNSTVIDLTSKGEKFHIRYVNEDWSDQRIDIINKVLNNLKKLHISPWEFCLSSHSRLIDSLTDLKVIGNGSFGQVYFGYLKGTPLAIKEAKLEPKVQNQLIQQTKLTKDLFPEENLILDYTNNFVLKKKTPNFVIQYHVALCNRCTVKTIGKINKGMCSTTFMEPAEGTLVLLKREHDVSIQISLLYQLLLAISIIHQELQLIHNDIKLQNILIKFTPELKGTYFKYVTPKGTFYVPNQGYLLLLADFGVSYSVGILSDTKSYGMRNAKVIMKNGKSELKPLISQYHFIHDKNKMIRIDSPLNYAWKINDQIVKGGTVNTIYKDPTGANINISEPIDISKPLEFPPQEFIYDVQDAIRTFVGGKRLTQSGYHPGFTKLNDNLRELLSDYIISNTGIIIRGPMSTTSVYHYLALEMLRKVYASPVNLSKIKISGVFDSSVN